MTLPENVLQRGTGQFAFRLSIESAPYEAVSHKGMELTAADGRIRYVGLKSDGFAFTERVDMILARWDAEGTRVRIADKRKRFTELFDKEPTATTYFDDSGGDNQVTASDTVIPCKSTAGFASSGRIWLDTECISYTSVKSDSFEGCTRGVFDTLAQYHYSPDGALARYPEITDWPVMWTGRRCTIYVYTAGTSKSDTSATAGTVYWKGVIASEPSFNGTEWSFRIAPLSKKFDQILGADLEEPAPIRGIYYPATAPLAVTIEELFGPEKDEYQTAWTSVVMAGFWETQEDFVAALNTLIAAAIAAPTRGTFTQDAVEAIVDGDQWSMKWVATNEKWIRVRAKSGTDNIFALESQEALDELTGELASVAVLDRAYKYQQEHSHLGRVPRATVGQIHDFSTSVTNTSGLDSSLYPPWRLYLGGSGAVTANTTRVLVTWDHNGRVPVEPGLDGFETDVSSVNTTDRYLDLERPQRDASRARLHFSAIGSAQVQVRMGRDYGIGHLGDFLTALTGDTAQFLNTGAVPDLRSSDLTAVPNTDIPDSAGVLPSTAQRLYTFFSPVKLADVIAGDCQLLGLFPCYASDFTITFRKLRLPTLADAVSATIDVSKLKTDKRYIAYSKNPFGLFGGITLDTGYNPRSKSWEGDTFEVLDIDARGRTPDAQIIRIRPLSQDFVSRITLSEATLLAQRLLGTFAGPHQVVDIEASPKLAAVLLGDIVKLTHPHMPDGNGKLGVSDKIAWVIERKRDVMGSARLHFSLLVTRQRVAGYSPASKLSGIAGTSGTTGPFTANCSADYFPTGTLAHDFFEAGDKIRLVRWNSTSTTDNVTATLTSATGNSLLFSTDSNWNHTGLDWMAGYQVSTSITAANQKLYGSIAGADGKVNYGGGDTGNPPFTLGP